jgi:chromosome segregation ATPase
LQKEIEIKNSKIRSLEKALTETEVFSIDLRENNQTLQESIDGLKSENLYYEKLLDRKILAYGDLDKKLVILEGFVGEIQGERDDLGRANGELLGLVEEGEAAKLAAERKFGDAQSDNRVLEDRFYEMHQKFG